MASTSVSSKESKELYYIVKVQNHVRGWLARKRVAWIPCEVLSSAIKEADEMDQGFARLFSHACVLVFFLTAFVLRANVGFSYTVNQALTNFMEDISFGEDYSYEDVKHPEDALAYLRAFFFAAYSGEELEEPCNLCGMQSAWGCNYAQCYNTSSPAFTNNWWCSVCQGTFGFCYGLNGTSTLGATRPDCTAFEPSILGTKPASHSTEGFLETCDYFEYGSTPSLNSFFVNGSVAASEAGGWIARKNKVLGAAIIQWNTYAETPCAYSYLSSPCYSADEVVTGTLFVNTSADDVDNYIANGGFHYFKDYNAYFAMLDLGGYNMGLHNGYCVLKGIEDTGVFSKDLKEMQLSFMTVNGEGLSTFSLTELSWVFDLGGDVDVELSTRTIPLRYWDATTRDVRTTACMLIFGVYQVIYALVSLGAFIKKVCASKSSTESMLGFGFKMLREYSNFWTLVEILSTSLFIIVCGYFVYLQRLYGIGGNYMLTKLNQLTLAAVNLGIVGIQAMKGAASIENELNIYFVISTLLGLLQLLKKMAFHKRLSLIIDVVCIGAKHFLHYFVVFFVIIMIYCNVGKSLLGPYTDNFVDFPSSFNSLVRVGLGEPGNAYDEFLEVAPIFGIVFMVTFQALIGVVLLNILISICVDAFDAYKASFAPTYDSVNFSLVVTVVRGFRRLAALPRRQARLIEKQRVQKVLTSERLVSISEAKKILDFYLIPGMKVSKILSIHCRNVMGKYHVKEDTEQTTL
mmetsp:Transcript_23049/g.40176  ORF Transcript_23049/g.40176 Transcript_23049/m.40176 type:complete len:744 (+) Transcript_23049:142-2373(+)